MKGFFQIKWTSNMDLYPLNDYLCKLYYAPIALYIFHIYLFIRFSIWSQWYFFNDIKSCNPFVSSYTRTTAHFMLGYFYSSFHFSCSIHSLVVSIEKWMMYKNSYYNETFFFFFYNPLSSICVSHILTGAWSNSQFLLHE